MIDDDFFSEIERAFFGGSRRGGSRLRESAAQNVVKDQNSYTSNFSADFDRVDDGNDYFVVVTVLDPVSPDDLQISIEDDYDDGESSTEGWFGSGDKVLSIAHASRSHSFLKIRIPKKIAKRSMKHTFNNGILEVRFGA